MSVYRLRAENVRGGDGLKEHRLAITCHFSINTKIYTPNSSIFVAQGQRGRGEVQYFFYYQYLYLVITLKMEFNTIIHKNVMENSYKFKVKNDLK